MKENEYEVNYRLENEYWWFVDVRYIAKLFLRKYLKTTPEAIPSLWSEPDVANHHVRRYYLKDFSEKLKNESFEKLALSHIISFAFAPVAILLFMNRFKNYILKCTNNQKEACRILPVPPNWVNFLLIQFLKIEGHLISYLTLPLGISMMGCFRKK